MFLEFIMVLIDFLLQINFVLFDCLFQQIKLLVQPIKLLEEESRNIHVLRGQKGGGVDVPTLFLKKFDSFEKTMEKNKMLFGEENLKEP